MWKNAGENELPFGTCKDDVKWKSKEEICGSAAIYPRWLVRVAYCGLSGSEKGEKVNRGGASELISFKYLVNSTCIPGTSNSKQTYLDSNDFPLC